MPKLKARDDVQSCSFDGHSYTVDKEGFVDVPTEAVADLLSHGFTVVTERAQQLTPEEEAAIEAKRQEQLKQKEADDAAAAEIAKKAEEEAAKQKEADDLKAQEVASLAASTETGPSAPAEPGTPTEATGSTAPAASKPAKK